MQSETLPADRKQEILKKVLTVLEHVAKRPGMYVLQPEERGMRTFLCGLNIGCAFAGLNVSREIYEQAAKARGWKYRALGIVWHMREKKLDEEAIVQELIAVEVEAFRMAAAGSNGIDPDNAKQVTTKKKSKPPKIKPPAKN